MNLKVVGQRKINPKGEKTIEELNGNIIQFLSVDDEVIAVIVMQDGKIRTEIADFLIIDISDDSSRRLI